MTFRGGSLQALASSVAAREVTAAELVDRSLSRIAECEGLNAWVVVDAERAHAEAVRVDAAIAAGQPAGALAGVPLAVKDMEDAAGFVTRLGSLLTEGAPRATADSLLTGRLRAAGCIVLGKTTTSEQGYKGDTVSPLTGSTLNPFDPTRSAGGSSGGTSVALATGMVPLGTGSDGGGSIRLPASICGFTGFKPTNGAIPLGGRTAPGAGLLAVRAPMATTARDLAHALAVCTGPDPSDPFSFPLGPVALPEHPALPERVGWCTDFGSPVDRTVISVCEAALARLEAAGCEVVPVANPFRGDTVEHWRTLWTTYRNRAQGHLRGTAQWDRIDEGLRADMDHGAALDATELMRAFDSMYVHSHEINAVLDAVPFLLTPTVASQTGLVARFGTIDGAESPRWAEFTQVINLTRHPAGSVPAGLAPDGMPVGIQIVGPHCADAAVLACMAALEDCWDTARIVPPR